MKKFRYQQPTIIIGSILVHLVLLSWFFPVTELFNDSPLVNFDHPFHQERSIDRAQYIADGGVIWGYNPRLMAGYVDGIIALNDGITHWFNFFTGGILGKYTIYKIWMFFLLVSPVFIVPLASSLFGFKNLGSSALVFTIILLNFNKSIQQFYQFGMGPFVISNFISLLSIAAYWKYCVTKKTKIYCLVLVLLPGSFLFHPMVFILQVVGYTTVFLGTVRTYKLREWALLVLLVFTTIVCNWHWIRVFLDFKSFANSGPGTFFPTSPIQFIKDYFFEIRRLPSIWIAFFGLGGLWSLWRKPSFRLRFWTLILAVLSFFILTYSGNQLGLHLVQGYRFTISILIFLLIPASYFFSQSVNVLHKRLSKKQFITFWIFVIASISPVFFDFLKRNQDGSNFHPTTSKISTITTTLSSELEWMLKWIEENTDKKARIGIQEIGTFPPIGNSHFMPMVAAKLDRELIGNYHYKSCTIYSVSSIDENFVGIPFKELTKEKVKQICGWYNIQYVILHEDFSKEVFRKFQPVTSSVAEFGKLEIFRVAMEPSFFILGNGILDARLNSIKVKEASAPITVIKYHYFSLLRTNPPLPIERYPIPGDPVDFIEVHNGSVSEFEIFTDYDSKSQISGP